MRTIITDYLDRKNVPYRLKPHGRPVFTSEDAAQARGVRLSQIVKTILLVTPGEELVVAVLPGDRKLNVKRIKKLSGRKNLHFLDRTSMENKLGLTVGAIAPVGELIENFPMFVDPDIFREEQVDISSGDPRAGLELKSRDLRNLFTTATITDISG